MNTMDASADPPTLAVADAPESSPPSLEKAEVDPAVVQSKDESSSGEESTATPPSPRQKPIVKEEASQEPVYKDYSHVLPDKRNPAESLSARSVAGKEPTFPVKLHIILSTPEFQTIICWLPHGRSWRIIQQKAFEERIIPLFFRHGRYSSFARQVNGWGFRRVTHGSDYNSYYHEVRDSFKRNF